MKVAVLTLTEISLDVIKDGAWYDGVCVHSGLQKDSELYLLYLNLFEAVCCCEKAVVGHKTKTMS